MARPTIRRDRPSIIEFITDPQGLGLTLSLAQEVLLRAIYGLPLHLADHLDLWRLCTGRETYREQSFGEVTVIAGARSGKDSRIAAPMVAYEAAYGGHEAHLARGERGVIPLVAQDQRATRVAFTYVRDYVTGSPALRELLEDEPLALELRLANRLGVVCFPCTLRSLRGFSVPAGVMDELGFYRLEGAVDSDAEIQASIRRGMLAFPSPRLAKISTPYMRSGVLYDDFWRAFGQDDPDLLVWKAPTSLMNPTLTPERLERERRLDPARFQREYEAEFAEDLEAAFPGAWLEGAVDGGVRERPPRTGVVPRFTVDPSGGGADAFTLAGVVREGEQLVQVVLRAWASSRKAQVDLEGVVGEAAALVKAYGAHEVTGDRYAGAWVRQAFARAGVTYRESPMDKSAAYAECAPLFAQGRVRVLDDPAMLRELKMLERRPRAGGKPWIDHPRGQHDDRANALCLAVAMVVSQRIGPLCW
jgi:hypothetical protein